jgi:hypothetical protein
MVQRYHRGLALSVLPVTSYDYLCGIFEPLYYLFFLTASGDLCGIFEPLYYLFFLTASDYLCGIV